MSGTFKRISTLIIMSVLFFNTNLHAQTQAENKAAEDFFFAIRNDVSFLFEKYIADKANKNDLLAKFGVLINTIKSSNMEFSKLQYKHIRSEKLDGLDASIVVIIYTYENKHYDDLFFLLDAGSNKILDIGAPAKAFQRNDNLTGKNINGIQLLSKQFFPNMPAKQEAIEAAKTLIKLAKADLLEQFTPLIAYRGTEDPTRKNLAVPLNFKNAKDKSRASALLSEIRGTFSSHESVTLTGSFTIYPDDASCYLRFICNENKNTGDFRFVLRDGKYLLSEFR